MCVPKVQYPVTRSLKSQIQGRIGGVTFRTDQRVLFDHRRVQLAPYSFQQISNIGTTFARVGAIFCQFQVHLDLE